MDENNAFKSNLKEYKKKCAVLFDQNSSETVKEDDLTEFIQLKTVLDNQFDTHNVDNIPDLEGFTKLDWQDLFQNMVNYMFKFENKAEADETMDFFTKLFSNQEKQYNPYEDF